MEGIREILVNFGHLKIHIEIAMNTDQFASRHMGIRPKDLPHMLKTIGADSLDQLIDQTVPDDIRLESPMELDRPSMSSWST